jgi:hypothetical protein
VNHQDLIFSGQLRWLRSGAFSTKHELIAGQGQVAATLAFTGRTPGEATAQSVHGAWEIVRIGFRSWYVTIRPAGTSLAPSLGVYYPRSPREGLLETGNGRVYYWRKVEIWRDSWEFSDRAGHSQVHFSADSEHSLLAKYFKNISRVQIENPLLNLEEIYLLLLLGRYLLVCREENLSLALNIVH